MNYTSIFSGDVRAKSNTAFLSIFQHRFAELVFVYHQRKRKYNNNNNNNTNIKKSKNKSNIEAGFYEIRLRKNRKSSRNFTSFELDPQSMECYLYPKSTNQKAKKYAFVCASHNASFTFTTATNIERNAWMTVFQQLQWQYNLPPPKAMKQKEKQQHEQQQQKYPNKHRPSNALMMDSSSITNNNNNNKDVEERSLSDSDLLWMSGMEYNSYVQSSEENEKKLVINSCTTTTITNNNYYDSSTQRTTHGDTESPSYGSLPLEMETDESSAVTVAGSASVDFFSGGRTSRASSSDYSSPPCPKNIDDDDENDDDDNKHNIQDAYYYNSYVPINNTFTSTPRTDKIRKYYHSGNLWRDNDLHTVTNTKSPCVCSECSGTTRFTILGLLDADSSLVVSLTPNTSTTAVADAPVVDMDLGMDMDMGGMPNKSNDNNNSNNNNDNNVCIQAPAPALVGELQPKKAKKTKTTTTASNDALLLLEHLKSPKYIPVVIDM